MKIIKNLFLIGLLIFGCTQIQAQVKFTIDYEASEDRFVVSMLPDVTWNYPKNLVSTAQVTLKAQHGSLLPHSLENLQNGVVWEQNSRAEAPEEAPNFDYISFGLVSLGKAFTMRKDEPTPLFAFKNGGNCQGQITFIDNATDAFMAPNSLNINVGNQISMYGAKGDAYSGIAGKRGVSCEVTTNTEQVLNLGTAVNLYPNPAVDLVNVELTWERPAESVEFHIYNLEGKRVQVLNQSLIQGENMVQIDVSELPSAAYNIEIKGTGWSARAGRFMKVN